MNNPKFGEVCWTELATPNAKTAKEFYSKLFGWQYDDMNTGDMTYTIIKSGDNNFGGIWQIPTDQQAQIPPHWMTYILVENAKDSLEKAKQLGAKVIKDVTQVGDMGRFAIIVDPTDAHLALWETLKK